MAQLLEIAAQFGIDQSYFYLFGVIVVLHFLLSAVYLRPYQKLIHDRKHRTQGARKEADELSKKAEEKFQHYKDRLKQTHERARTLFSHAESTAKREEAKILGAAATKTREIMVEAQKDLEQQRVVLVQALAGEAQGISKSIVEKVLGRSE